MSGHAALIGPGEAAIYFAVHGRQSGRTCAGEVALQTGETLRETSLACLSLATPETGHARSTISDTAASPRTAVKLPSDAGDAVRCQKPGVARSLEAAFPRDNQIPLPPASPGYRVNIANRN